MSKKRKLVVGTDWELAVEKQLTHSLLSLLGPLLEIMNRKETIEQIQNKILSLHNIRNKHLRDSVRICWGKEWIVSLFVLLMGHLTYENWKRYWLPRFYMFLQSYIFAKWNRISLIWGEFYRFAFQSYEQHMHVITLSPKFFLFEDLRSPISGNFATYEQERLRNFTKVGLGLGDTLDQFPDDQLTEAERTYKKQPNRQVSIECAWKQSVRTGKRSLLLFGGGNQQWIFEKKSLGKNNANFFVPKELEKLDTIITELLACFLKNEKVSYLCLEYFSPHWLFLFSQTTK